MGHLRHPLALSHHWPLSSIGKYRSLHLKVAGVHLHQGPTQIRLHPRLLRRFLHRASPHLH